MKFQFKINKFALIRDIFALNDYYRKKQEKISFLFWLELEKRLWKKFRDEPAYYLINPIHSDWALNEINICVEKEGFQKIFLKIAKIVEKIYKEITKTKEFKKLFSETKKYKIFVEKQWGKNEEFVLNYLKKTLGVKIPNYTITVYIFHPKSYNGCANYRTKSILWGHSEDWKNYTTIYLTHEIIHIITAKKSKDPKIMHTLTELAIDNELRMRLNKKGRYFKEGKFDVGHPYLRNLEKKILPYWKEYLKNRKGKNIFDLEKKITKVSSDWKIK